LGATADFAGSRGEALRPEILDPKRSGRPDVTIEFATLGVRNTAVVGLDQPAYERAAIRPAETIDPALTPFAIDTVKLGERWELTGVARWDRAGTEKTLSETLLGIDALPRTRAALIHHSPWFGSYYAGMGDALNPAPAPLQLAVPGVPGDWGVLNLRPADAVVHEAGAKVALLGGRINVRATAFRAEKDATVSDESHRINGVQLNAVGRLAPHWHVLAGYGQLDSTILVAPDPAQLGNQAGTAPHAAKLWTSYAVPSGFAIGGGARYAARRMADNANTGLVPEFVAFDASLAYKLMPQVELQLALQNIADAHWYDGSSGVDPDPAKARTAKLSSQFRF
jgi:catecholate siderophore receptor